MNRQVWLALVIVKTICDTIDETRGLLDFEWNGNVRVLDEHQVVISWITLIHLPNYHILREDCLIHVSVFASTRSWLTVLILSMAVNLGRRRKFLTTCTLSINNLTSNFKCILKEGRGGKHLMISSTTYPSSGMQTQNKGKERYDALSLLMTFLQFQLYTFRQLSVSYPWKSYAG